MIYLYTKTKTEDVHEVKAGIYGRPVHTHEIKKLMSKGWARNPADLLDIEPPKPEKTREEVAEELGISIYDEDGKKLHYKLIDSAIQEHLKNEHNEG